MKSSHRPLVPRYAWAPLAAVVLFNFLVYSGTKLITAAWPHHTLALPLDAQLPFVPGFICIYVLAFVQWVVGYVLIVRDSEALCFRMTAADLAAKLLCMVCFLAFPTTMTRPTPEGGGLWCALTRLIYWFDKPVNLFPSVHCLESWICMRGALASRQRLWVKVAMTVMTLLVCASTVLVKQHLVLDIAGGIAAAELGLLAVRLFGLDRRFARLCRRLDGGRH